jgi:hypothetical protein
MKYELFLGGIALIGFAYFIYKTLKWSNLITKTQYVKTAQKLKNFAIILMSTSAGLFFIAKSLLR